MAKPTTFSSKPTTPKGGSTSFNFGANVKAPKSKVGGKGRKAGTGGGS